jgi:hypothetical protein
VQVAFFRRDGSGAKTIRAFSNYIRGERVKGVNRLLETNSSGGKDRRQELVCLARASLPSAGRPGESTQKKNEGWFSNVYSSREYPAASGGDESGWVAFELQDTARLAARRFILDFHLRGNDSSPAGREKQLQTVYL